MAEKRINYKDISTSVNNIKNLATRLEETINNLDNIISKIDDPVWDGTASTKYKEKIKKIVGYLPDANRQLAMSALFLASVADGYESIDKESVSKLRSIIGEDYINNCDVNTLEDIDLSTRAEIVRSKVNNTANNTKYYYVTVPAGAVVTITAPEVIANNITVVRKTQQPVSNTTTTEETKKVETIETKDTKDNKTIEIPDNIDQGEYILEGYDKDLTTGLETHETENTYQSTLKDIWKDNGSVFTNGIATINIDNKDRNLVTVSEMYGNVGDLIDVELEDGSIVNCIIADTTKVEAEEFRFVNAEVEGESNIFKFKVSYDKYLENNDINNWNLSWNNKEKVKQITNLGKSIIGG